MRFTTLVLITLRFSCLGSTVLAKKPRFTKEKKLVTSTKIPSLILSKRSSVMCLGKMYRFSVCKFHHCRSLMLHSRWRLHWLLPREVVHLNLSNQQSVKTIKVSLFLFILMLLKEAFWIIFVSNMTFICQLCMTYASKNFRRYCRDLTCVHPFEQSPCNVIVCQSKYTCVRPLVWHLKNKHLWFWDKYWRDT